MSKLFNNGKWILFCVVIGTLTILSFQNCAPAKFTQGDAANQLSTGINDGLDDSHPQPSTFEDIPQPPIAPPPIAINPSETTPDPVIDLPSPPTIEEVLPNTPVVINDPAVDKRLKEIVDIIHKIDPSIKAAGIYFVDAGLINLNGITEKHPNMGGSFLGFKYQRHYTAAIPGPESCKQSAALEFLFLKIPLTDKKLNVNLCSGFIAANEIKASKGKNCQASSSNVLSQQVTSLTGNLYKTTHQYIMDTDCLCRREFNINLLQNTDGNSLFSYKVKVFVNSERCI